MVKRKHHSEEAIIRILKEAENGMAVADLLRKYNISQGTYYRWKTAYSGMQLEDQMYLMPCGVSYGRRS
jgi:putative transposase